MSRDDYLIGKRVQVPVWSDTWMKGDRYGTIVSLSHMRLRHKAPGDGPGGALIARVKLDKSGKTKPWRVSDLEVI
jgi:hypothetical protein